MLTQQLKQRLVTSTLSILAVIIAVYYSHSPFFKPLFVLFTIGITYLAIKEYCHLAEKKGFNPLFSLMTGCTTLYFVSLFVSSTDPSWTTLPSFVLLFSFLALFVAFFIQPIASLSNLAVTSFGILYLTIPLSYVLKINYFFPASALEDGRVWLAYAFSVSKVTDIAAYFFGKALGKHKLAPFISPQKTIEGSIGGLVASVLVSVIFASFFRPFFEMTLFQSLWVGVIISVLAQMGDLAESLLKRDAGVKDSSDLPGLGGVLDIVDSLIFTLPFVYLFLKTVHSS